MTPLLRDTLKTFIAGGVDPVELNWFDISNAITQGAEMPQDWLRDYRPPFEKCVVVWECKGTRYAGYQVVMLVVGTDPEEGILISAHKGPKGQMPRQLPMMVYAIDGDMLRYGSVEEDEIISEEEAALLMGLTAAWYKSLAHGGCTLHTASVAQTFTNRRKIAAGKAPTYDWHTVTIKAVQAKRSHQGGTHASPRLHDRRGHLRRLRNGKNVWVRPCKVGDASKGTVFKDYVVGETV